MTILDRLPIPENRTSLRFGDRFVTIHANQILVWVSVQPSEVVVPEESTRKFPALLDTGNNFGFSVQERHLSEWAGIDLDLLEFLGNIEINGQVVTRREATVWLYPNALGRQDAAEGMPPFRLDMSKGIAVYAHDAVPAGPRLPLLGLPALLENDLGGKKGLSPIIAVGPPAAMALRRVSPSPLFDHVDRIAGPGFGLDLLIIGCVGRRMRSIRDSSYTWDTWPCRRPPSSELNLGLEKEAIASQTPGGALRPGAPWLVLADVQPSGMDVACL